MIKNNHMSPLQTIEHPIFSGYNIKVQIKRDDLIHHIISGNKWRKLQCNLQHIQMQGFSGALSFGGSYSNHIHAFAFACYQLGIPSIGIIRGEAEYATNYTLRWAQHWGMKCYFVDRKSYRRRFDADFLAELTLQHPNYFIIPEGGSNHLAVNGVSEIMTELAKQTVFDTLLTPVGSGGTLAGLISGDAKTFRNQTKEHKLLGVAVLKQAEYLTEEVKKLLTSEGSKHNNWEIMTSFHRGGYGKFSNEDVSRIIEFNQQSNLTFEPVYSGKMLLAFLDLLEQGYFQKNERIVLLHTGGIQGIAGMLEQQRLNQKDWPSMPFPISNKI
jgi:1-aminocyclopropane-1-carboxylate deaminase